MSEIRMCTECGKPFNAASYELCCPKCYEELELAAFLEEADTGSEVYCGHNPRCPWCGCEQEADFEDPDYYTEGDYPVRCSECGELYCLSVTVSYSYSASRDLPFWMQEDLRKQKEARDKYLASIILEGGLLETSSN